MLQHPARYTRDTHHDLLTAADDAAMTTLVSDLQIAVEDGYAIRDQGDSYGRALRRLLPAGTRLQLVRGMEGDPLPIAHGSKGAVTGVDDAGTIHVQWDSGRTLGVCLDQDEVVVIPMQQAG